MTKNVKHALYGLAIVALCIPCFALTGFEPAMANFVGDPVCADCHDDTLDKMTHSMHTKALGTEAMCEACHGAGSKHVESEGEIPIPRNFSDDTRDADVAAGCVACHTGGTTMEWHDSGHSAAGVLCIDCHDVKAAYSKMDSGKLCQTCHADQQALFNLPSHHPVKEGLMSCVDCHNPHAGTDRMLKGDTTNELCFSCHADKQGPFFWEHDPVVEDCLICHDAKGAMNNSLLKSTESALCLRCHTAHDSYHAIERWRNDAGEKTQEIGRTAVWTKCTRCHQSIHGSDMPMFTRGALLR
jgi:DmsE family decaheme c-type cytochrome